jgi:uncharacterized membrane protein
MGEMAIGWPDAFALAFFIAAWTLYHTLLESRRFGRLSLNALMHRYRMAWMEEMLHREVRIIDTQIMTSLQNGTAFFASTSLLVVGGSLALLRATDDVLRVFGDLPLSIPTSRVLWEMKVIGLTVIFVYAFFKFAWSYRLFNYAAILIGATPSGERAQTPEAHLHVRRTGDVITDAGRQFNRGQRAFFFALAYAAWFVSSWALVGATVAVLVAMVMRQFRSAAHDAVTDLSHGNPAAGPD